MEEEWDQSPSAPPTHKTHTTPNHSIPSFQMDDESKADLNSRIRNITEKISLGRLSESANAHRQVAGSIGTETPLMVLTEIRESQGRLLDVMKGLVLAQEENEIRDETRHRELCTVILGMYGNSGGVEATLPYRTSTAPSPGVEGKSHSYYGSTALTSGIHLVSCILMHLDIMLTQHSTFRKIKNTDTTFMDVKEWHVLCSSVINSDKNSKAGLRVPKPTDEDFKSACRLVASPIVGRRPSCDQSHISLLLSKSPALMNTVEWCRQALLKCPGVLSPERFCRFKHTKHPFVDSDQELSVESVKTLRVPNRSFHREVSELKITKKKEYMRLMLELGMPSIDALSKVKQK